MCRGARLGRDGIRGGISVTARFKVGGGLLHLVELQDPVLKVLLGIIEDLACLGAVGVGAPGVAGRDRVVV